MTALLPLSLNAVAVRRDGRAILGPLDFVLGGTGTTVVLGPNGAGKTTFLRLMFGLDQPDTGTVDGALTGADAATRKAYVFQKPTLLRRSVLANAAYPLEIRGLAHRDADNKARTRLSTVSLGDKLHQHARALSAGEAQKLAVVRAMVTDPELLFLDEPTANLDGRSTREIEAVLTAAAEQGTRIVLATHDLAQARRLADDIVFLARGAILEHRPAGDFFAAPRSQEATAYLNGEIVE